MTLDVSAMTAGRSALVAASALNPRLYASRSTGHRSGDFPDVEFVETAVPKRLAIS
jgi:hypothetical protein